MIKSKWYKQHWVCAKKHIFSKVFLQWIFSFYPNNLQSSQAAQLHRTSSGSLRVWCVDVALELCLKGWHCDIGFCLVCLLMNFYQHDWEAFVCLCQSSHTNLKVYILMCTGLYGRAHKRTGARCKHTRTHAHVYLYYEYIYIWLYINTSVWYYTAVLLILVSASIDPFH